MGLTRSLLVVFAWWAASSLAAPHIKRLNDAPPTPLTAAQISAITPFADFAAAAYCPLPSVKTWTCGAACRALPGVVTLLTGGDNQETPDYYVAYYPSAKAIVVSHRGTNTSSLLSLLDDGETDQVPIDPTYFPGTLTSGINVHMGFQATFERTAATILTTVEAGIATYNTTQVYVIGHSLGAAIAVFDALYLHEKLATSIPITTKLFGLPRVGNQAFANYVDAQLPTLRHVVNYNDIVPHLPPAILLYVQPSGEIWIESNGSTYESCPGQENQNCADSIPLTDTSTSPHDGPYAGVLMTCTP